MKNRKLNNAQEMAVKRLLNAAIKNFKKGWFTNLIGVLLIMAGGYALYAGHVSVDLGRKLIKTKIQMIGLQDPKIKPPGGNALGAMGVVPFHLLFSSITSVYSLSGEATGSNAGGYTPLWTLVVIVIFITVLVLLTWLLVSGKSMGIPRLFDTREKKKS